MSQEDFLTSQNDMRISSRMILSPDSPCSDGVLWLDQFIEISAKRT